MAKRRVSSSDPATRSGASIAAVGEATGAAVDDAGRAGRSAAPATGDPRRAGAEGSVVVRVRPGAGRTRVGGRYEGPHGPALIVAVGAPAVDGKATEAVRLALADALGVKAREVVLKVGATSRDKIFTVAGDVGVRLAALRDGST
ncbi:hypothetical protein DMB66_04440 [Actinoplanes sp. ATCC 53533]|nr:hypothetical protein DMB66_04440 [Actinoplanes sp. ATCC 53533]